MDLRQEREVLSDFNPKQLHEELPGEEIETALEVIAVLARALDTEL